MPEVQRSEVQVNAIKVDGRGVSRKTGGMWVVWDGTTGEPVAYGTPANHPYAVGMAQRIADKTGRDYIATARPTYAECEADIAAHMSKAGVQ